ncbi:Cnl2/NKP2 family protein-domain-containing protein [Morchella snyderi]|nr:Cnl2/NKP2 family protein-domain-containing protein [Morchella snyderi]
MAASSTTALEYEILSSFLLSRASLQDIISLRKFTELFPKDKQSNPQVKLLYAELQLQRNKTCDRVKKNLQFEARLGAKQRRDAKRQQREEQHIDDDATTGIELFGAAPSEPKLPLGELLQQMTAAAEDLDSEFKSLDRECDEILGDLKTTIGDLSDLRYGKFANASLDEKVVSDLENLHKTCERVLNPDSQFK